MMRETEWTTNLVDDDSDLRQILSRARRIAIIGIKPEDRAQKPAFYVPRYLQRAGYEIIPVPVYYPDVRSILGQPVYRSLAEIPGDVDLVVMFRRPEHIPQHVPDLLARKPPAVWFQLGIRNEDAARQLAQAGIRVVQDRCSMVEHRRLLR